VEELPLSILIWFHVFNRRMRSWNESLLPLRDYEVVAEHTVTRSTRSKAIAVVVKPIKGI
jgi:hypothetical protein